jgi:HTH-type transcriptional regulator/antitoxin HigA
VQQKHAGFFEEPMPRPPGEYIREELENRGWGQADLAAILGRPLPTVNEIIQGKRGIMPEMAVALGTAFGTGASIWMQREAAYRLSLVEQNDSETRHRARLYEIAPVKEMEKRGWIKPTKTTLELEKELCRFFDVTSFDSEPQIQAATRQTLLADELTAAQRAWIFRASKLASILNVRQFIREKFVADLPELRSFATSSQNSGRVACWLAEKGIRMVVVEALPKTRIDGAAFWLHEGANSPVVVLSLRYDRIDAFWHTLLHEIRHIVNGDKRSIDSNLVGESKFTSIDEIELRADKEAAEFLIPTEKMESFIIRTQPYFSKERILQFAQRIGVHPGIIVGQLQHRGKVPWHANREMLAKVRDVITTAAATDGFGKQFYEAK